MSQHDKVTLFATGDVGPRRLDQAVMFDLVRDGLKQADVRFCQVERVYSERGAVQVHAGLLPGLEERVHPNGAEGVFSAGFDVASFASNHCMDWGPDALLDTIDLFRRRGVLTAGVGKNIDAARQPAVLERKGVRIAFLAYCSILKEGYGATENKAGCAPMRAKTYYEPYEYQAGTPVKIITVPVQEDLEALQQDVRKAKQQADVVCVSLHWGLHYQPKAIAMYQPIVGHAAIDAGADVILGHHAHILKGIEVYKGKAIFYSLCNFAMSNTIEALRNGASWQIYRWELDREYPVYAFPPDSRKTMIAKCVISKSGIEQVSFLPVMINKQAQPEMLRQGDARFGQVLEYLRWISDEFPTKFRVAGDEVVIES